MDVRVAPPALGLKLATVTADGKASPFGSWLVELRGLRRKHNPPLGARRESSYSAAMVSICDLGSKRQLPTPFLVEHCLASYRDADVLATATQSSRLSLGHGL